jgi:hypothetical protein
MQLRQRWVDAIRTAVVESEEAVSVMARLCARQAEMSVEAELQLVEQTLPTRYAGITEKTMDGLEVNPIIDSRMGIWRAAVSLYPEAYRKKQTHVISQSKDVAKMARMLFGTDSPRGAWWQVCSDLQSQARWVSLSIANTVRMRAMKGFNSHG